MLQLFCFPFVRQLNSRLLVCARTAAGWMARRRVSFVGVSNLYIGFVTWRHAFPGTCLLVEFISPFLVDYLFLVIPNDIKENIYIVYFFFKFNHKPSSELYLFQKRNTCVNSFHAMKYIYVTVFGTVLDLLNLWLMTQIEVKAKFMNESLAGFFLSLFWHLVALLVGWSFLLGDSPRFWLSSVLRNYKGPFCRHI